MLTEARPSARLLVLALRVEAEVVATFSNNLNDELFSIIFKLISQRLVRNLFVIDDTLFVCV